MKTNYPKELHGLLVRQLDKLNLDYSLPPSNREEWKALLQCISNTYNDSDQDRYLIERSLEISSHELSDLNKKLEDAQRLSRVGYWLHDLVANKLSWSKEMYILFGFPITHPEPTFEQITQIIHPDDKIKFEEIRNKSLQDGKDYEIEMRFMNQVTKQYYWFNVIGHPFLSSDGKVTQLSGTVMDITRRKEIENKIVTLNQQLFVSVTRAERMAEVAISVLHNVGNILNSVNVSIELVRENIEQSKLNKLAIIVKMIQEHLPTLNEYFTKDPKGQLVPEYLISLSQTAAQEYQAITDEIKSIDKHIQYIKQIITTQQSKTIISNITEKNSINDLIETALQMAGLFLKTENITVKRNIGQTLFITVDESKILLILVNLIQNAKEAFNSMSQSNKEIILSVKSLPNDRVSISIEDNGMGITPEDLQHIFSFGFSTKSAGHGFGLHSSALAANELGGTLQVESNGLGKGSVFTLILPLISQSIKL